METVLEKTVLELTSELCEILRNNYYLRGSTLECNFIFETGRKYLKIIMVNNQRCVHGFVDKKTGDLYMAAGWSGPAKGIRYNLVRDIASLREMGKTLGIMWAGGYLYR